MKTKKVKNLGRRGRPAPENGIRKSKSVSARTQNPIISECNSVKGFFHIGLSLLLAATMAFGLALGLLVEKSKSNAKDGVVAAATFIGKSATMAKQNTFAIGKACISSMSEYVKNEAKKNFGKALVNVGGWGVSAALAYTHFEPPSWVQVIWTYLMHIFS